MLRQSIMHKQPQSSLLGYGLRQAAASEMLYGGVRVSHLSPKPFPLKYVRSEELPSPSLERERHDLMLEMQLPADPSGYNQVNMNIQRQLGSVASPDGEDHHNDGGFNFSEYFSTLFHPERHQTSSLPYSTHDTNNVLGLRLFPLNMGVRLRVEAVRVRTEDCLQRLRDWKQCGQTGSAASYPIPLHQKAAMHRQDTAADDTLYSGSIDPRTLQHRADGNGNIVEGAAKQDARRAHLRGGPSHAARGDMSIFTRPQDQQQQQQQVGGGTQTSSTMSTREAALAYFRSGDAQQQQQAWMPLQMLKPMGHTWSPSVRGAGSRGPTMQLAQERLDQKGFGWKRKSRSLWQQDVDTAGFRPHRYF